MQRRFFFAVFRVDVRFFVEQRLRDVGFFRVGSDVQRGFAVAIFRVNVGALGDQELDDFDAVLAFRVVDFRRIVFVGGGVKRGFAVFVFRVHVGAFLDEVFDDFQLRLIRGGVERGFAVVVASVDLGALLFEEGFHLVEVAPFRGANQRQVGVGSGVSDRFERVGGRQNGGNRGGRRVRSGGERNATQRGDGGNERPFLQLFHFRPLSFSFLRFFGASFLGPAATSAEKRRDRNFSTFFVLVSVANFGDFFIGLPCDYENKFTARTFRFF